jgi:hypothetical protein
MRKIIVGLALALSLSAFAQPGRAATFRRSQVVRLPKSMSLADDVYTLGVNVMAAGAGLDVDAFGNCHL